MKKSAPAETDENLAWDEVIESSLESLEADLQPQAKAVLDYVRKNPVKAAAIAATIGFIAGKWIKE